MKRSVSHPILLLIFPLLTSTAVAQFERFKPRSRAVKKPQAVPQVTVKSNKSGNNTDKKNYRFVNLNPETGYGPSVVKNFDHPNTSLKELTKFMQKLTGINLILSKELKGKVSILAPGPITVGDAWRAYLSALNAYSYTLVKTGAFYKIVPINKLKGTSTKIYTGAYTPDMENYVMRIITLKHVSASQVVKSFKGFMPRGSRNLTSLDDTNTIIAQGTGQSINQLMRLIKFVDVPGHDETLQIIKVQYSSAKEIASMIDEILGRNNRSRRRGRFGRSKRKKSGRTENISRLIADPRTNTIIAMANAEGTKKLRTLIKRLDTKEVATGGGQIHVYYLNHGNAEEMSKTLNNLVNKQKSRRRSGGTAGSAARRQLFPGKTSRGLFNDSVHVTADKDNNAIVATASPTDYLTLKEVIKKLDIPRDQVYVEGLMMETQISKGRNFGISILGAYGSGAAQKGGFTRGEKDGLIPLLTNQITSLGGFFAGSGIGKKVFHTDPTTGKTIKINSVNALISAIASNANTNILATPQILALDNVEATFEVGETIPVPERTNAANGSSTVTIRPQNVGLSLKITPQINRVSRFVKLKIVQNIDDFSERALPSGVESEGIATIERSTETTVVVRDRDTVAMGGLMRDKDITTESKVPLLGDIPILGWLFKNRTRTKEKMNLLFFMTPRILANYQLSSAEITRGVINRRANHLEHKTNRDPFLKTAKSIYDKVKKQSEGPLYDVDEAQKYHRQNEGPGIQGQKEEELENQSENGDEWENDEEMESDQTVFEIPDYQNIIREINKNSKNKERS